MTKNQKELVRLMKGQGLKEAEINAILKLEPKKSLPSGIKAQAPCIAVEGEYEGNATMTLKRGDTGRPFTFGKGKAQMIVEQYEAIKAFAAL